MADNMVVKLILSATDKMSGIIRGAVTKSNQDFVKMQQKIKGTSESLDKIGKKALIAGGVILTLSGANLKMAADFESSMSSVSTLIDTHVESMQDMNLEVLGIAKRTPVALNELTGALYDIRSAGMLASDQFNILEHSAQLGVAGLGTTKEAVDLVTSSINAFNLHGAEQNRIYDLIFKTVKTGKTTISGLAQGFGAVAGTVAAAGIKIDDYLASVAALTTTGQPAAQAHTQIKAAIAGLTRGTKDQQKIFRQLHAKDFNDLIQKSGGMVGAFSRINRSVKGNKSELISLLGSIEAYNAVLSLTGNQNKAYTDTLIGMRNGANAVDEAFEKKLGTVTAQTQRFQNYVQKIGIEFGNSLLPVFTKFLDTVGVVMDKVDALPPKVKSAMSMSALGLGIGLTALGGLSIAAGAAVRGFGDCLSAYQKVALYMAANKITIPDLKFTINGESIITGFNKIRNLFRAFGRTVRTTSVEMLLFTKNGVRGIIPFFKTLPANIIKTTKSLYAFTAAQIMAAPAAAAKGFTNISTTIKGLPNALKAARTAMLGFNLVVAANPIGLVIALVAGAAFMIYKYWRPISGFFRGLWRGIVEATAPLQPAFQKIAQAVKPLVDWFKRLIKPVDDVGGRAEAFGFKIGKAIGGAITWGAKLISKVEKLNRIFHPSQWSKDETRIDKELSKNNKVDGSHANGLSFVPFDGYTAELHRGERILTANENKQFKKGSSISSIALTYAPTINAGSNTDVRTIKKMLEEHERQMLERMKTAQRRREARAYV